MAGQETTITVTVAVGLTTTRPVIPEQHTHHVRLAVPVTETSNEAVARAELEAQLLAAQIVAAHRGVEMPTSTTVLAVEI